MPPLASSIKEMITGATLLVLDSWSQKHPFNGVQTNKRGRSHTGKVNEDLAAK